MKISSISTPKIFDSRNAVLRDGSVFPRSIAFIVCLLTPIRRPSSSWLQPRACRFSGRVFFMALCLSFTACITTREGMCRDARHRACVLCGPFDGQPPSLLATSKCELACLIVICCPLAGFGHVPASQAAERPFARTQRAQETSLHLFRLPYAIAHWS